MKSIRKNAPYVYIAKEEKSGQYDKYHVFILALIDAQATRLNEFYIYANVNNKIILESSGANGLPQLDIPINHNLDKLQERDAGANWKWVAQHVVLQNNSALRERELKSNLPANMEFISIDEKRNEGFDFTIRIVNGGKTTITKLDVDTVDELNPLQTFENFALNCPYAYLDVVRKTGNVVCQPSVIIPSTDTLIEDSETLFISSGESGICESSVIFKKNDPSADLKLYVPKCISDSRKSTYFDLSSTEAGSFNAIVFEVNDPQEIFKDGDLDQNQKNKMAQSLRSDIGDHYVRSANKPKKKKTKVTTAKADTF